MNGNWLKVTVTSDVSKPKFLLTDIMIEDAHMTCYDVSVLLQEIITEARNLSNAEILTSGAGPRKAPGSSDSGGRLQQARRDVEVAVIAVPAARTERDESYEIRIPADQGIAGHVATTGKILNIKDAYSHPLFYRGVDDSTGFRTRNILCFPIKNENQEVIGVAELVNKINGPWFSKFDEDLATAFSIYCGISIAHSLLYKKVNEAQYRSHLANEMMMYHMKVSDDEYTKLLSEGIQPVSTIDPNFASFTYTPRSLPEDDTSMAILSMLQDMNFINTYKMDRQTLTRWVAPAALHGDRPAGMLEKAMGNRPLEMMDREKAYIPELQISFMEHIAMPIYK
nr:PREDICTED: cGMP-dependent 3',5'-cyclic phosphodiesterase-like [Apteryx mantelli mantelli]